MANLSILNPQPALLEGARLLHELISHPISREGVAVEHISADGSTQSWTFSEIYHASQRLAKHLVGFRQDDTAFVVPLQMRQSPQLYITQIAILIAGAAFCPLPMDIPEDRLKFILQDINASCVVVASRSDQALPDPGENVQVLYFDELAKVTADAQQFPKIRPEQSAYVMYTSGSTGRPKGVIISHLAATQALLAHDVYIPQFSRFLQFASPTFDVSVFEIFFPLFRHATLVSCDRQRLLNDLAGTITQYHIDAAELTPSVASSLLRHRGEVPDLRLLLTIGEMLKRSVVEEFGGDNDRPAILHAMYGPTEATIHCTVQPACSTDMTVRCIGKPLSTVSAFVVAPLASSTTSAIEILPLGDEGELAVGGFQLADGYLNRPEQTAASFVHHPDHGRLYRTGDLARINAEGLLECCGRISDGQVKLHGQRIELGEVEYAAVRTEGCLTAAADIIDNLLVVFCTTTSPTVETSAIRDGCRRWLPEYMVPHEIIRLTSLPYLASGKIDRKALKSSFTQQKLHDQPLPAGLSAKAKTLARIIGEITPIRIIQETSSVNFHLNSLDAIRLSTKLANHGFPRVDATKYLEARSLTDVEQITKAEVSSGCETEDTNLKELAAQQSKLAKHVLQNASIANFPDVLTIYPCTPTQCAMLAETARKNSAYRNTFTYSIDKMHDLAHVRQALSILISKVDILRTGFLAIEGFSAAYAGIIFQNPTSHLPYDEWNTLSNFSSASDTFFFPRTIVIEQKNSCCIEVKFELHHALYDQWSGDIMRTLLGKILERKEASFSRSFVDVAKFHARSLNSIDGDSSIEFWSDALRDCSPTLVPKLNAERTKPGIARTPWVRSTIATANVQQQAQNLACSVPSLFQTATAYMLGSLAGSDDITMGIVMSGRNIPVKDIEWIIGPCLVTIPTRTNLGGVSTISELLRSTNATNKAAQSHLFTPLAVIKRAAGLLPGESLFDSIFIWQETSLDTSDGPEHVVEIDSHDQTEFSIVIEFEPRASEIFGRCTYRRDLVTADQADCLLKQINSLVDFFCKSPTQKLADLRSCFSEELLSVANVSPSRFSDSNLVLVIEQQVKSRGFAPAIAFSHRKVDGVSTTTWTYEQLNKYANRIAHHLMSITNGKSGSVGIWMEKSTEMYATMLASWKVGCGYLPLTADTPVTRARSILDQGQVRVCFCDSRTMANLPIFENMLIVDIATLELTHLSAENPDIDYVKDATAYTIFTSGSTGVPKGVPVSFGNIGANIAVLSQIYDARPEDRMLQACSQAFDVSVFEIFFSLANGMCLCSATKDLLFEDLEESIRRFDITHLSLTPTVAAMVDPTEVPSVRFLVTAGEGVTEYVQRRWAGRGLHQGYGPSETTNICTLNMNMKPQDHLGKLGTVFPNVSGFVISPEEDFVILPKGAHGEFAFGGEQVFKGYSGRPDLTAKAIINHPLYGPIYRSGDMGRMLHDGTFFFSGRQDDQIKLRGNRIELEEINRTLVTDDGVGRAATVVLDDGSDQATLASFWTSIDSTAKSGSTANFAQSGLSHVKDLFSTLEDKLPQYMIPTYVVPVNAIPFTAQSKVDKRCLIKILRNIDTDVRNSLARRVETEQKDELTDSWSQTERDIADAVSDTLGLSSSQISRASSLFALGLNSLNALQLARRIRSRLDIRVPVNLILTRSSISRLARAIHKIAGDKPQQASDEPSVPSSDELIKLISPSSRPGLEDIEYALTCTPLQEAMLSASQEGQESYWNLTRFRITGNVERLKISWLAMIKKHAILRTQFFETEDPDIPFVQITRRDLAKPLAEERGVMHRVDARDSSGAVSMLNPYRLQFHEEDGSLCLSLHMHHALYDGISMSLLLKDVEDCYHGRRGLEASSISQFIAQSRSHRGSVALSYWSSLLAGYKTLPFSGSPDTSGRHVTTHHVLEVDTRELLRHSTRYSVTQLSILQTAWVSTLSLLQDIDDVCFGNVVSGRSVDVDNVDKLVAPCFNTIPVRVDLRRHERNIELNRFLHKQNTASSEFELAPLRKLQKFSTTPDLPLFESLFIFQPPAQARDETLWVLDGDEGTMDMPLVIEITPASDSIAADIHYDQSYFERTMIEKIFAAFNAAILSCLHSPEGAPKTFLSLATDEISGMLSPPSVNTSHNVFMSEYDGTTDRSTTWTPEETTVRNIFSQLAKIDVDMVHRDTSLYRIGLDSLHAAQVAAKLSTKGLHIKATDVLRNRTPAAIAAVLTSSKPEPTPRAMIDLRAFDHRHRGDLLMRYKIPGSIFVGMRPCTTFQEGLLAASIHSQGSLYVNHVTFAIPHDIQDAEILQAWQAVCRKHQILRMGFAPLDQSGRMSMIIYSTDFPVSEVFQVKNDASIQDLKGTIQRQIIDGLHLSAWRCTISETDRQRALTLSIHHALYDGRGLNELLSDFGTAIAGHVLGRSGNFDQILRSTLNSANLDKDKAKQYWAGLLKDSHLNRFPNLHPNNTSNKSLRTTKQVAQVDLNRLDEGCRSQGISMQSLGQSAWAKLLAAYTGDSHVIFGTIFSEHDSGASNDVVFPRIYTIPVHCDTETAGTCEPAAMMQQNDASQPYRTLDLNEIKRAAGKPGETLFDTVFIYQKQEEGGLEWPVIEDEASVEYSLSLELIATHDTRLIFNLTYDSALIPDAQASRLLQQYEHVLCHLLFSGPSSVERADIYSIQPPSTPSIPSEACHLQDMVESAVLIHSQKPALTFVDAIEGTDLISRSWTYQQLDERGNQIAHLIYQHGGKPGDVVAVSMEKCPEASFAFLGILKAGCSFLAMDPELPLARKQFILKDSQSSLLLVAAHGSNIGQEVDVPLVKLVDAELAHLPSDSIEIERRDPQATCYNLYTSGTTGNPKGCEISHENAVQAMLAFQRLFAGRWDNNSRWLQFASYWFDVSILEHFWTWSHGLMVVGAPRDLVLEDIPHFIRTAQITHIDLTPSLARFVKPEDVPTLHNHVFITGGEAIKQEIIDAWGPVHTVCNGYGPTEATIGVTMLRFLGSDTKPSNIGTQFDNVGTLVLVPDTDEPVLRGAVGELCITGKLVGKGYLNRPEQTAKAFPYLRNFRERVYRTGDLVRMLHDNSFSFIGRKDTQVKLRGQRLEIGEIEHAIRASNGSIIEAVCQVVKSADGDRQTLIAFLTLGRAQKNVEVEVDTSDAAKQIIRDADQACRSSLPPYMVPTHFVTISFMPLTVNNKIDSKKLVALYMATPTATLQSLKVDSEESTALTDSEQTITDLLCKLLEIEDKTVVTRQTNTFSLGLSSITAIAFAKVLQKNGFKNGNVRTVMRNATIKQLSDALVRKNNNMTKAFELAQQTKFMISAFEQRSRHLVSQRLGIPATQIEAIAPCTPLQEGMLLDSFRSRGHPYFNSFQYVIKDLVISRLQEALAQLTKELQMLRVKFLHTDDGYLQAAVRDQSVLVEVVEKPEDSTPLESQRQQWLDENRVDVLKPIAVQAVQNASETQLTFFVHHALYDGISWQLFMARLIEMYDGNRAEMRPNDSKYLEILQYGPLQTQADAQSWWQTEFKGWRPNTKQMEQLELPSKALTKVFVLEIAEKLERSRKTFAVSHQTITQTAFEVAVTQLKSGIRVYGSVVSGRSLDLIDADKVIGPLFNTLPIVCRINTNATWHDHVQHIQARTSAMMPYQHTPLRAIKKWIRCPADSVLFDSLFVFQMATGEDTWQSKTWHLVEQEPHASFPLAFEAEWTQEQKLRVEIVAQAGRHTQEELETLAVNFEKALELIFCHADNKIVEAFSVPEQSIINGEHHRSDPDQFHQRSKYEWSAQAQKIREVVAAIAGVELDEIEEDTSLFTLGLDSIDAIRLSSRLRKEGIKISMNKIIQAQTIPKILQAADTDAHVHANGVKQSMVEELEARLNTHLTKVLPEHTSVERLLPATPNQEALIADMIRSGFEQYYNYDILRLRSDVNFERIQHAWQTVVDNVPILRAGFIELASPDLDSVFALVIHKSCALRFETMRISSDDDVKSVEKRIRSQLPKAQAVNSSLTRLTLVESPNNRYLVLSLSHALYDGHSLALIHEALQAAYHGRQIEQPSFDKVLELALRAKNQESLQFWESKLSGLNIKAFPHLVNKGDPLELHRAEQYCSTSARSARVLCRRLGCSMQTLAQTAWALTLAQYTQSLEVCFGIVLACRENEESEQVIFPTMNTTVMRTVMHGTLEEMLKYVQAISNEMLTYQRTPLRQIQQAARQVTTSDIDVHGLFDTLFIYQHRPETISASDAPMYESVGGYSSTEYPVASELEVIGDHIVLRTACKGDYMDKAQAATLLNRLNDNIDSLVNHSGQTTLTFSEGKVSICKSEAFKLSIGLSVRNDEAGEQHSQSVPQEFARTTALIQDAIARVAKVSDESVSPMTSIGSLGIDSISAIKVVALLRKEGLRVSVSEVLRNKTPVRIAIKVKASSIDSEESTHTRNIEALKHAISIHDTSELLEDLEIHHATVQQILPASAGQVYMINAWNNSAGRMFYSSFAHKAYGLADEADIRDAWARLVDRHDILRTVFCSVSRGPAPLLQIVLKPSAQAQSILERSAMASLSIEGDSKGWLLRIALHHALYDAVSLDLLMTDFEYLLRGESKRLESLSYVDFLALSISDTAEEAQRKFWTTYLSEARLARLPVSQEDPSEMSRLDIWRPKFWKKIRNLEHKAHQLDISTHSVLFAIYAKLYMGLVVPSSQSEKGDVVLGVYLSNRSHLSDLARLVAPTLNLVPLLIRSPESRSVLDIAKQIQVDLQDISSSATYSAVALWQIVEWTGIKIDAFVNFVKVPEIDDAHPDSHPVRLVEFDENKAKSYSTVTRPEGASRFMPPPGLQRVYKTDAYLPSLDLEASITDGNLNVGVFCPESIVTQIQVEVMLSRLEEALDRVIQG